MTVKEAINYFKTDPTPRNLWHPAYDVAVEALEKQTPKKPIEIKMDSCLFYNCPSCNERLIDGNWCAGQLYKYCPHCGQHFDWSKNNNDSRNL